MGLPIAPPPKNLYRLARAAYEAHNSGLNEENRISMPTWEELGAIQILWARAAFAVVDEIEKIRKEAEPA